MMVFIAENLAPIMFVSLVAFLLMGYPVAFSLAANGLFFFFIGVELAPLSGGNINLSWPLLTALPDRFFGGVMANDTLLAIPFFTLMGIILERSGMAEDLLDTVGQLFGPVRGGVAYAVIIVGALLAATTGVVAASVIAMGLISLPVMLRYGYNRGVASGVIAASGTLAQIIPPSLVLIVLADQLGRSVGDMYKGALLPALLLTGLYILYIMMLSIFRPSSVPALPPEVRTLGRGVTSLMVAFAALMAIGYGAHVWLSPTHGTNADILGAVVGVLAIYAFTLADKMLGLNIMSRLAQQVIMVLIPPLALVFLVLGTIFLGIATPTEAGAMGAVGAMVLAFFKRRLSYTVINHAVAATTRLSAFVLFILIGARVFSLTFYGVNGHIWVEHLLTALPGGEYGFLFAVNLILFFLGFFLDFFELAFIIVPLIVPAANNLGIDLVFLGVILGMNMQTSFLTPPFGFALFYLRSVVPKSRYLDKVTGRQIEAVRTRDIYTGAIPFIFIQVLMILLVIAFPGMVMHYKGPVVDTSNVTITLPQMPGLGGGGLGGGLGGGGLGGGLGAPGAAPAPGGLGGGLGTPPGLAPGAAPAPAPAAPAPVVPGLGLPPGLQAPAPAN
ncbi:TRAP transporter large permease subunit [Frigidibacter albus]|uniref:TRAP transporter large permease subunit n=1 Tax=Frigidibacter albus TaxID=1465486 RepID=A0A6L8VG48_9RHOB|nr:TRAP transporter large permease subunit [Frigidibacter albus]MZQ88210.1 TRAP transporter large permease subunit [Frigidibacter albus]NBE30116.1 TRAP transporter large permease subunit [Frigidibacter albus]GGH46790.1 C4-dicarboxylate ABC transporter [Frigidibacter albus]